MKIGEYIKQKQPKEYKKLMKKERKQEHLSFYDIEKLMQEGCHAYKRAKGGAYRQIK